MDRFSLQDLISWNLSADRKPLILKGARQVGKTWLMKEFGRTQYKNFAYFNFDEEEELKSIFVVNKNPDRIVELLSLISGTRIEPEDTLIIFDEIQECPEALNSLKYFKEKAGQYHVVAAGSLLGTLLAQPKSYPVGMVNILEVGPLNFAEFLKAKDEGLYSYYAGLTNGQSIEDIFHTRLLDAYHHYLIIGGMPECVSSWLEWKDPQKVIQAQRELPDVYENDDFEFELGKAQVLHEGNDLTIVAAGETVWHALEAAKTLEAEHGVKARVLDCSSLKPFDHEAVRKAAAETGRIITVEEHSIYGGLGAIVTETLAENPVPVKILGIPDENVIHAKSLEIFDYYGFNAKGIVKQALEFIK